MSRRDWIGLCMLLLVFFSLTVIYNAVSPSFEAPDEVGHFYFIVYLLDRGRLPVVPAAVPPPNYEQEGIQAPLYYLSSALVVRALSGPLGLDLSDASAPIEINPYSTCGRVQPRYNLDYFEHDVHAERFPYQGRIRVLHVVRLWSSLLATLTVAGVFAATRLAFPSVPKASWLAAGVTAFIPEFIFTAAAVNNDNMVTVLATWGIVLALYTVRGGISWARVLAMGLIAGLAGLSKLAGSGLILLSGFVVLIVVWRDERATHRGVRRMLRGVLAYGVLLTASYLLVMGWWVWRNWTLYGDLTGIRPHLALMPVRDETSFWALIQESPGLFRSWWGTFGCTAPPAGFYLIGALVTLAALAGLLAARDGLRDDAVSVAVLLLWLGLMLVAYIRWNWIVCAPKGRLVYPAMASVGALIGRGLAYWTAKWRGFGVGTLA